MERSLVKGSVEVRYLVEFLNYFKSILRFGSEQPRGGQGRVTEWLIIAATDLQSPSIFTTTETSAVPFQS